MESDGFIHLRVQSLQIQRPEPPDWVFASIEEFYNLPITIFYFAVIFLEYPVDTVIENM